MAIISTVKILPSCGSMISRFWMSFDVLLGGEITWQDLNIECPSEPMYYKKHIGVHYACRMDVEVQHRRNFKGKFYSVQHCIV